MPEVAQKKQTNTEDQSEKRVTKERKRPVVYSEPKVQIITLTADLAKEFLGWEEETEKIKLGDSYVRDIKPIFGRKVRLTKNMMNRPITPENVLKLTQEILKRRWMLNLENRIIGTSGQVLNGQHTFLALILASELLRRHPENYPAWKKGEEVKIETSIGFGADESDEAVNTMDTCLPRSLYDVICRSPFFRTLPEHDRKVSSKYLEYAVKILWHRLGIRDAFGLRRNHSEALDFIKKHERLLECVKHLREENGSGGKISRYLSPGNASGLMYLMGTSKSDPIRYRDAQDPTEELLDFSLWGKAQEFVVELAKAKSQEGPTTEKKGPLAILTAYGDIIKKFGREPSNGERWGILINAWNCFVEGKPITLDILKLSYTKDEDGVEHLDNVDCPTCGGIDLGNPEKDGENEFVTMISNDDPTDEEIAEVETRKALVKESKQAPGGPAKAKDVIKRLPAKVSLAPKRAGKDWAKGDIAWVRSDDGDHYLATLADEPYIVEGSDSRVMVNDGKAEWEVLVRDLSLGGWTPGVKKSTLRPLSQTPVAGKKLSKPGEIKVGRLVWVKEAGGDPWQGRLVEQIGKSCKVTVAQGHQGAGSTRPAHLSQLSATQPGGAAKA